MKYKLFCYKPLARLITNKNPTLASGQALVSNENVYIDVLCWEMLIWRRSQSCETQMYPNQLPQ